VRFKQAKKNIADLYTTLTNGDVRRFIDIVEYEALSLHAMMLTSYPGYLLIQPSSIEIIRKVREFRNQTSIPLGFTLDAGPNIHLLFPAVYRNTVNDFVQGSLTGLCSQGRIISDCVGSGPVRT
jgi:diphosphomevalonate decarboxylase